MGMEAAVVLFFAALAGAVLAGVRYGQATTQQRVADLRGFVRSHGWRFSASGADGAVGGGAGDAGDRPAGPEDDLTQCWPGPPFHPGGGVARPVVSGTHRGRGFLAFEYLYEVTPSPAAKTAIPHRRAVVTVPLPGAVPDLAVTRKNAIARILARPNTDVPSESGGRYQVACTDPLFAATVLQPQVVEILKAGPAWEWRFAGDAMVGYQPGQLTPDRLLSGLDALADVLDRIPAEAWRHGGRAVS